jgi:hypothetical protein
VVEAADSPRDAHAAAALADRSMLDKKNLRTRTRTRVGWCDARGRAGGEKGCVPTASRLPSRARERPRALHVVHAFYLPSGFELDRRTSRSSPHAPATNHQLPVHTNMSAVASLSAAPVAARAVVSSTKRGAASKRSVVNKNGAGASNRRRSVRLAAVTEPPAAPVTDVIAAFCADQMPDEAAMLAASTFPISPEVRKQQPPNFGKLWQK